jgi:hypothetical protein
VPIGVVDCLERLQIKEQNCQLPVLSIGLSDGVTQAVSVSRLRFASPVRASWLAR